MSITRWNYEFYRIRPRLYLSFLDIFLFYWIGYLAQEVADFYNIERTVMFYVLLVVASVAVGMAWAPMSRRISNYYTKAYQDELNNR